MDYAELDIPTPRPDELCRDFVRRLDPWPGYVIAGALLTLGCLVLSIVAMITVMPKLGIQEKTLGAQVSSIVALALGLVAAYLIFTRWRRARMARKGALIRNGVLTTAVVEDRSMSVSKGRTDVDLRIERGPLVEAAFNVWFSPGARSTIRVLWLPQDSNQHMLAFDDAGRMYSGHIKGLAR
jgi:hypothetical protein